MARRLANFIIALSFVACAAVVGLWVRSYFVSDLVIHSDAAGDHFEAVTIPGQVRLTAATGWISGHPWTWYHGNAPPWYPVFGQRPIYHTWYLPGFAVQDGTASVPAIEFGPRRSWQMRVSYRTWAIPFHLPLAVTLIGPAWLVIRARRRWLRGRRWAASGRCARCGYDLRASPDCCPECGTPNAR